MDNCRNNKRIQNQGFMSMDSLANNFKDLVETVNELNHRIQMIETSLRKQNAMLQ